MRKTVYYSRKSQFEIYASILIIISLMAACGRNGATKRVSSSDSIAVPIKETVMDKPELPPLPEGEIKLSDEAFGSIVNLKGEPLIVKENIKPEQLFVKGKYLITNNQRNDSIFMVFELPSLKCIAAFGVKGNGPDEFGFPKIVETAEDTVLFYIYEMNNEKIYKVSERNLKPEYYLTLPKNNRSFDSKQIVFINSTTAYYASTTLKGKGVYSFYKDSIPQDKILNNLASPGIKGSWTTFIGDFGINIRLNRMVYAYKYFKRLKMIDMLTMKESHVIFEAKNLEKGLNDIATLEPTNITHYWGISANDDCFWLLYSGRTPVDVQRDNRSNKKYIYVEKFDWNCNPVKRYKLDDWGYFCVDKKNEILYLASTASIHSLIKYNLADTL